MSNTTSISLPNGQQLLTRVTITSKEQSGLAFLVFVAILSLITVAGLLGIISLSAFHTRSYRKEEHLFVRTHVAAYFISLLCCNIVQAIGSLYNSRWIELAAVELDRSCTTQGVFKQAADVGSALWTLVIALHTFSTLVLETKPTSRFSLFGTLIGGWSGIFAVVIFGPAVFDTVERGPFFGISGYWCSISNKYETSRITLDYLIMFIAALFCFVILILVYLRLRGYLTLRGWHMTFYRHAQERPTALFDDKGISIVKEMYRYPIAYSVMIFPISIARLAASTGHAVSFEGTVFCEAVILLSGCVNVILFCTTRQILPPESIVLMKRSFSKPKPRRDVEQVPDCFSDVASVTVVGCGFNEGYKHEGSNRLDTGSISEESSETVVGYGFSEIHNKAGQTLDVEKGDISTTESSTDISIPPTRKAVRRPRPPSVLVPIRRISSVDGLDQIYDVYSASHLEPAPFKNFNLRTNGPSTQ